MVFACGIGIVEFSTEVFNAVVCVVHFVEGGCDLGYLQGGECVGVDVADLATSDQLVDSHADVVGVEVKWLLFRDCLFLRRWNLRDRDALGAKLRRGLIGIFPAFYLGI